MTLTICIIFAFTFLVGCAILANAIRDSGRDRANGMLSMAQVFREQAQERQDEPLEEMPGWRN